MAHPSADDSVLENIERSGELSITLDRACWLVWPTRRQPTLSAAMSSAQFVHVNAPVVAIQRNGRMEYFDEQRQRRWSSNLAWPRANLEMARLPARPDFLAEDIDEEDPDEDDSTRA